MSPVRRLLVWAAVPLYVGGCLYNFRMSFKPTIGYSPTARGAPVRGLPQSATIVRYFLPGAFGPSMAFEFDVSEKEFEAWVAALPSPKLTASRWRTVRCQDSTGWPRIERDIADGPVYSWQQEDRSIVAAFDRSNGRAYYFRAYR